MQQLRVKGSHDYEAGADRRDYQQSRLQWLRNHEPRGARTLATVQGKELVIDQYELYHRETPNGLIVTVIPLTYGRARVTIGRVRTPLSYDDVW